MNTTLKTLTDITAILQVANVAAPIISGTIIAIASIIRGVTGTGPTLSEIADMLEARLQRNDVLIRAEIARMDALGDHQ